MIGLLRQVFGRGTGFPPPTPDTPLSVIGDIHGRVDLLEKALRRCEGQIVLVGDYIDRGEDSAAVLRLVNSSADLICLIGNHEEMLLRFLDAPGRHGSRWLRYGGLQTLASFGVAGVTETSAKDELEAARDALADAMGPDLISWIRHLPSIWSSGNIAVTHAGADPAAAITDQEQSVLRWGHPLFEKKTRSDGMWIVHGHTIVDAPYSQKGRIAVDTGAYATGRLTVAILSEGDVRFETVI